MTTLYEKTEALAPPNAALPAPNAALPAPAAAEPAPVQEPTPEPVPERDPFMAGAEAALRRAAKKARQRNIALTGSVVSYRDGKVVYDTEP